MEQQPAQWLTLAAPRFPTRHELFTSTSLTGARGWINWTDHRRMADKPRTLPVLLAVPRWRVLLSPTLSWR